MHIKNNKSFYLLSYLLILLAFSYFFLILKHQVGNDSTISEWLINYEGGFTRRGLVGQLSIEISRLLKIELRTTILILQLIICSSYFYVLYNFLKNLPDNRIIILSIFTPIFIFYPVAEIEVLARKEVILFLSFLLYLSLSISNPFKTIAFILFTCSAILIWEPVIFFFPFIFTYLIIQDDIEKFDIKFFKIVFSFIPSLIICFFIIFYPLSLEGHQKMVYILNNEFEELCYMSCSLLRDKSTLIQQFKGNTYSFEILIRYFLIILIGFFPLAYLVKKSKIKNNNLLIIKFLKKKNNIIILNFIPILLLFAMGSDWGRWVNVTYVMSFIIFFKLIIEKKITLPETKLENNFFTKISKTQFIIIFLLFSFGWNPKTLMSGDIGSFPGYRVPYKVFKIINN